MKPMRWKNWLGFVVAASVSVISAALVSGSAAWVIGAAGLCFSIMLYRRFAKQQRRGG